MEINEKSRECRGEAVSTEIQPVVVLGCRMLEPLLTPLLDPAVPATFLDYGLHARPVEMQPALQEHLDALAEPATVIIGYGLCGNGVVGLSAGRHTLVLPKVHDCVAMVMGSHEAYFDDFRSNPGTYYLTRGWLDIGEDPLHEYERISERRGREFAERAISSLYGGYRRLCLLAFSSEEMDEIRPQATPIVEFCQERWGVSYDELIGDPSFIERLAQPDLHDAQRFLRIPPGGEVTQEMYLD
jgi:hypothetical protein